MGCAKTWLLILGVLLSIFTGSAKFGVILSLFEEIGSGWAYLNF